MNTPDAINHRASHDLIDQSVKRFNAGGGLRAADHGAPVRVVAGEIGQRADPLVFVLDPDRSIRCGGQRAVPTGRGWIEVFSSAQTTSRASPHPDEACLRVALRLGL